MRMHRSVTSIHTLTARFKDAVNLNKCDCVCVCEFLCLGGMWETGNLTRMGKFTIGSDFKNVPFVHARRL